VRPGATARRLAALARRAARPLGREDGYLLAAAMLLVAVTAILSAKAAVGTVLIHRREMEQEWKFRAERIVRAIQDYNRDRTGGRGGAVGQTGWPKLEELTKPPRRHLHAIPPDPLTAEYDDNGDLKEGTGRWQPIFPGPPQRQPAGGATAGGAGIQQNVNPLPCGQKMPGWEKNRPIVGVYSCADGESVQWFGTKQPGSPYKELFFYIAPQTPGQQPGADAGQTQFPTLIRCPGPECLVAGGAAGGGMPGSTARPPTTGRGPSRQGAPPTPGRGFSRPGGRSTPP
jgi:hypothetical protein